MFLYANNLYTKLKNSIVLFPNFFIYCITVLKTNNWILEFFRRILLFFSIVDFFANKKETFFKVMTCHMTYIAFKLTAGFQRRLYEN